MPSAKPMPTKPPVATVSPSWIRRTASAALTILWGRGSRGSRCMPCSLETRHAPSDHPIALSLSKGACQDRLQCCPGVAGGASDQTLRRRLGYHAAAAHAALGAEVDDPVGLGDDVEVVLDHDHAVAAVDQPVQHADQLLDVGHVQAHR